MTTNLYLSVSGCLGRKWSKKKGKKESLCRVHLRTDVLLDGQSKVRSEVTDQSSFLSKAAKHTRSHTQDLSSNVSTWPTQLRVRTFCSLAYGCQKTMKMVICSSHKLRITSVTAWSSKLRAPMVDFNMRLCAVYKQSKCAQSVFITNVCTIIAHSIWIMYSMINNTSAFQVYS